MDEGLYGGLYERIQRVGNGTYGVIYKVKSVPKGQIFIAKHIPLHNLDRAKALLEFKILQKLRHHYIVKSVDSFEQDDELILIMEYCGQKDLAWHIDQRRKTGKHFSEYLVTNWILQMLLAVGFMHSNKIVHRDLKPQNVFVDSQMNVKLGDFGISRLLDFTAQNCQTSAGTPSYMAPEMVQSMDYSFKADIWSLGCVIYEICSLERLFPLKDAQDKPIGLLKMMDMIKHKQIKDIPSLYSEDLRKLVKKMLNRIPQKRPQAGDLLKDKLLVQLMINRINEKDNLKTQYMKGHEVPSLSNTMLDRQAQSVKQQLKKLSLEVGEKMTGLKQKKVQKNQLQEYEKELKRKMKEVQNAVKQAFQQLYQNGKFAPSVEQSPTKINNNSSNKFRVTGGKSKMSPSKASSNLSSLSNSSDMTIQSVQLKSQKQVPVMNNDSDLDLVESAMVESIPQSLPTQSKKVSPTKKQANYEKSINMNKKPLGDEFQTTVQSQYATTLQQELSCTLQSAYEQTMNNPQAMEATLNRLDAMKITLQKNPEAVLSNSFMDCSLELSGDRSMPRKLKQNPIEISGSIEFELTKREPPKSKTNFQRKIQNSQQYETQYAADFQEYNENYHLNQRRQSELEAMLSLYQEELSRQDSFNGKSTGFRQRQKYLVMSEIKEQSSEGSSVMSRNTSFQT